MTNPWKVDTPFDVMFTDTIELRHGGLEAPFKACVFPCETVDPFAESSTSSSLKAATVLLRARDLLDARMSKPKIGDAVEDENGDVWKVMDVAKEMQWWRLEVRRT